MPEKDRAEHLDSADSESAPTNGADTAAATKERPSVATPRMLPPFRVLLHNDDVNEFLYVTAMVLKLTPLSREEAVQRTLEAHETGVALLMVTHKERAELVQEQFASCKLTVTIEPE
jgi:ATP-dependent Clp protease adaptor protein ClpS